MLWFLTGLIVGACLGFVVCAALQMSRDADGPDLLVERHTFDR
jgi:hypothetical protein